MSDKGRMRKGDRVSWKSHGTDVIGRVTRKITGRRRAAGRTVDAAPDAPQYEVRSEKTGRRAVHKPKSLHKKNGDS